MDLRKLVIYKDKYGVEVTIGELVERIANLEKINHKNVDTFYNLEYKILMGFSQKDFFNLAKYKRICDMSSAERSAFCEKFKASSYIRSVRDRIIKSYDITVAELCERWGMYTGGEFKEDE